MEKNTVQTTAAPEVFIDQMAGNLTVKGWDRDELTVTAPPSNLKINEQDDIVRLSCQSDCIVRLPFNSRLHVEEVRASFRAKFLEDLLDVNSVHGHLDLRDVAGVKLSSLHGNFSARRLAGDLQVEKINGNLTLRDVQGDCTIGIINGNLDLREVDGEIRTKINGNARLRLSMLGGSEYSIEAEGNIHCRIPVEASLNLILTSRSETIRIKLPETTQTIRERDYSLALGAGDVRMSLSAGGAIYLYATEGWEESDNDKDYKGLPEDFGDQIAEQVEAQIEAQMEIMNRQLNEQFERLSTTISKSELSGEEIERIMEQARIRSEKASLQAQEKMRRAQEILERKLEAAQRRRELRERASRHKKRKGGSWTIGGPSPSTPDREPVSEEERLVILRMLEEKKITAEQAEQLLAALEGQGK